MMNCVKHLQGKESNVGYTVANRVVCFFLVTGPMGDLNVRKYVGVSMVFAGRMMQL